MGIPFDITTDYQEALQHSVILVYPEISGSAMTAPALHALARFPKQGGTLIGFSVLGGLQDVFGFKEPLPSYDHREIRCNTYAAFCAEFTDPKERIIPFAPKRKKLRSHGERDLHGSGRNPTGLL